MTPPSRVVALQRHTHAYDECFYAAIEELGVPVIDGSFSGKWLIKNLRRGDYVHLQFPSFCYALASSRRGLVLWFARFVALLALIRARGAKLLWTAHNLMPHDPTPFPGMDRLARRIVIALSDQVFVHGPSASDALLRAFPGARTKVVQITHGHWVGYYPQSQSKSEARTRLGIGPDPYVFLFLGLCKEYKNVHGLIEAFRSERRNGRSLLLIAGKFQRSEYRRQIVALAQGDPRIRLYPEYIPDAELQTYLTACDCVVLPYLETLTSGAAMLALSFGRPVVSVRRGSLQDTITSDVGVLCEPGSRDALDRALDEVTHRRFDEASIVAHARTFSWTDSARAFLAALGA